MLLPHPRFIKNQRTNIPVIIYKFFKDFLKGCGKTFCKKFSCVSPIMFLHVGNNRNIRERDIIGIFDADTSTVSTVTRKFLSAAQKRGEVESSSEEIPKSFVLYIKHGEAEDKYEICFSQLSSAALLGRSGDDTN